MHFDITLILTLIRRRLKDYKDQRPAGIPLANEFWRERAGTPGGLAARNLGIPPPNTNGGACLGGWLPGRHLPASPTGYPSAVPTAERDHREMAGAYLPATPWYPSAMNLAERAVGMAGAAKRQRRIIMKIGLITPETHVSEKINNRTKIKSKTHVLEMITNPKIIH